MKMLTILILSFLPLFFSLKAAQILPSLDLNGKTVLQLEDNEIALFSYGSLMLLEELHDPLYTGPFIQAELSGFTRAWSARYPNSMQWQFADHNNYFFIPKSITYLNLEPCTNCHVNGMIFIIKAEDLDSYDKREAMYNRIKINDSLVNISVLGGNAYTFTAKSQNHFPTNNNISKNDTVIAKYYPEIIQKALNIQGEKFTQDYINSSQPLPLHLVFPKTTL